MVISDHRNVDLEHGLLLCATLNMLPYNADIKGAFLQRSRSERLANCIYLRQPREGVPCLQPGQPIALMKLKLLFGFADFPRPWWITLQDRLPNMTIADCGRSVRVCKSALDPGLALRAMTNDAWWPWSRLLPEAHTVAQAIKAIFPCGDSSHDTFEYRGKTITTMHDHSGTLLSIAANQETKTWRDGSTLSRLPCPRRPASDRR